ncbi:dihydropyrimidinase [Bellilinea sp.]|jgi:dihydropyrimidinase|uniref:dihydropyrimidinase n=1 Tax=Bellilinea sp. TaxID=2838785 RepID=UPI002ADDA802|nr:dihydropyrimidinase [Bellilinea sp.]
MKTLLKGGTLVTASEMFRADILIEDEKIALIGLDLAVAEDTMVLDVSNRLILPGGVDPHTHFDLPMFGTVSSDDHYTGHKAAAFGGTTTVIDFVPLENSGIEKSIALWREKADPKAAIDFSFHMNISRFDEQIEAEMAQLTGMGITSVKVFSAYNNRLRLSDENIFRVMRVAKKYGLLTMLHAENGDVIELLIAEALAAGHTTPEWHALTRPAWTAVEAVLRGAALAAMAEAPLYIVHMNAAGEVDQLAYARSKSLPVMGETCPQYLFFTIDHLRRPDGAKWVCSPPMRSKEDNERLWQGLESGIIQVVGTDHCPFFYDGSKPILYEGKPIAIPGKELGKDDFTKIPNGLPAVGDRLPVLWSEGVVKGRLSPSQFVALTSTNPARIFGLYPRKGSLTPGADADIVVWDAERVVTYGVDQSHHRTDYNLFEGWTLTGFPEKVFLRGNLIVDGKQWLGSAGMGRFIQRNSHNPVL